MPPAIYHHDMQPLQENDTAGQGEPEGCTEAGAREALAPVDLQGTDSRLRPLPRANSKTINELSARLAGDICLGCESISGICQSSSRHQDTRFKYNAALQILDAMTCLCIWHTHALPCLIFDSSKEIMRETGRALLLS